MDFASVPASSYPLSDLVSLLNQDLKIIYPHSIHEFRLCEHAPQG